jgi:GcrA cell cycle regulator
MTTWTEERIAELRRHWEAGLSASESAEKLGSVTRNAVAGTRYRLGLRDQMRSAHPQKSREGMKARKIHKSVVRQTQRPEPRTISVPYRKRFPRLPEMSKAALRDMLRCAVENTI